MNYNVILKHPIKTTAEWAAYGKVLPKQVLCFEDAGATIKMKLGDGTHKWNETPYVGTEVDFSNFYNKTEIETLVDNAVSNIGNIMKVVGVIESQADLPPSGESIGDVYLIKDTSAANDVFKQYIWTNGGTWDYVGSTAVDMSNYYSKSEVDEMLAKKVAKVSGKGLSTEDFTTLEKEKLTNLESYSAGAGIKIKDGIISLADSDASVDNIGDLVRMVFPQVEITGAPFSAVTMTKGNRIYNGDLSAEGSYLFKLPELGEWEVKSGSYSRIINISAPMQYASLDITTDEFIEFV